MKFKVLVHCLSQFAFLLAYNASFAKSANVLFYFGISSYSHRVAVWPLVEKMAEIGHNVTFLSPYPPKQPNPKVTEFIPKFFTESMNNLCEDFLERRIKGIHQDMWEDLPEYALMVCGQLLRDSETKDWIKRSKFDLVVVDHLFNECSFGLAYKFKAKFVIYSTSSPFPWYPDLLGHVPETSWIPDMVIHPPQEMAFFQKVANTMNPIYWAYWIKYQKYYPKLDTLLQNELDLPGLPSLRDLEQNTELIFINTHYSIEYARSLPPNYIPVGGLHITTSNDDILPKNIQAFIDGSGENGFIYVSFGTVALASQFPTEMREVFYRGFGSFSSTIRFIWKWDWEKPNNMPNNVMIVPWAPQQKLLAHKNIRGFITHGGQLSIQEAIWFGVPIIIFPIFADQDWNAEIVEWKGLGLKLEIVNITQNKLTEAITKILTDSRFKARMSETSIVFKDRPQKPIDLALWWMEYVLRNDNTSTLLRPLTRHQTWYQRRLLDVWLFVVSILMSVLLVVCGILYKCLLKIANSKSTAKVKKY